MSGELFLAEVGGSLAALAGTAAYTRVKAPAVYWSTVGLPATAVRFATTYGSTMDACGLTVAPSRLRVLVTRATTRREIRPVPPRIRRIRPTATGLRVRLRLAPGQEPADVAASAERLRHAWGVHSVHVAEIKPGIVELRMTGFDVLRRVRMPRRSPSGDLVVPVALREDGTAFVRDYRAVPHAMTLGATLAGKSVYIRNLITGLATRDVAIAGIDCKRGVEQAPFAPRLSALATDTDMAADLLDALVEEMENRYDLIRDHQGIPSSVADDEITSDIWGLPAKVRPTPVVLIVDEIAELFLVASRKEEARRDQMVTQLIRLAQLGRAAGMFLEASGQRFGAELGKGATMLRAQLTGRVVHRVNDKPTAEMGLGDISPEAVLAATQIAPEMPGVAIAGDTSGGWSRIRTPNVSLAEAAAICRQYAHLTPALPTLAAFRPHVPASPVVPPKPSTPPRFVPNPAAE
ncbi:FtsK/SpoIIIE domain-containing protein [Kitasatospora paracochleata]|uniref:S-DNA-T family DNA segregation ATPase FtsK/SpoIIIE n=1 Tax=Kitasatospora paracochleata TaxID=58354 RepID=A0ABT1J644_9ACTN|nr:FtsK/SpoIIIE domain-containing protein [Kitasatospora paracochleata]MCP2312912.1 S-DNA-T family DNA segregation ATPase FtsK/SpoIIIE [Kitasatospora paracochleata]